MQNAHLLHPEYHALVHRLLALNPYIFVDAETLNHLEQVPGQPFAECVAAAKRRLNWSGTCGSSIYHSVTEVLDSWLLLPVGLRLSQTQGLKPVAALFNVVFASTSFKASEESLSAVCHWAVLGMSLSACRAILVAKLLQYYALQGNQAAVEQTILGLLLKFNYEGITFCSEHIDVNFLQTTLHA
jgi:hypothetical protein